MANLIARALRETGYAVDVVGNGTEAVEQGALAPYDLVVLDILLPGMDGFSVCRQLRAASVSTPILMLSARSEIADRVRGLELGADDYLPKPFAVAELRARVGALMRRRSLPTQITLTVGSVRVDRSRRSVEVRGGMVELTGKEYALLEYPAAEPRPARDPAGDRRARLGRPLRPVLQPDRGLRRAPAPEDRPARGQPGRVVPHDAARRGIRGRGPSPGDGLIRVSIRWKLTLWYGAALGVVLVFFSAATYLRYRAGGLAFLRRRSAQQPRHARRARCTRRFARRAPPAAAATQPASGARRAAIARGVPPQRPRRRDSDGAWRGRSCWPGFPTRATRADTPPSLTSDDWRRVSLSGRTRDARPSQSGWHAALRGVRLEGVAEPVLLLVAGSTAPVEETLVVDPEGAARARGGGTPARGRRRLLAGHAGAAPDRRDDAAGGAHGRGPCLGGAAPARRRQRGRRARAAGRDVQSAARADRVVDGQDEDASSPTPPTS